MYKYSLWATTILTSLLSIPSIAHLKVVPEISLNEIYSDNVNLTNRAFRETELITEIVPMISLSGEFDRKIVEVQYMLEGIHYNNNSRQDKLYQRGSAHYDQPLFKRKGHFYADGVLTQQVLFPQEQAFNTILNSESQSNVGTFQLGPDLNFNIGRKLNGQTRFRYGQTHYFSEDINHAKDFDASGSISSGSVFTFFQATLQAAFRQTTQTNELDLQTSSLNSFFQYQLLRRLQLLFQLGYENTTNQQGRSNSIEGVTWYGGFRYAPTRRTQISFQKGERSFGESMIASLTWFRKRHNINISYDEDITTFARQQIDATPRAQISNVLSTPVQFVPTFNNEILVTKRLEGNYSYLFDRTTLTINLFQIKDQVLNSELFERGRGLNLSVEHQVNSQVILSATSGYTVQRFFTGEIDKRIVGSCFIAFKPTRHFEANAGYSYFRSNSGNFFRNTFENLVSVGFRMIG